MASQDIPPFIKQHNMTVNLQDAAGNHPPSNTRVMDIKENQNFQPPHFPFPSSLLPINGIINNVKGHDLGGGERRRRKKHYNYNVTRLD